MDIDNNNLKYHNTMKKLALLCLTALGFSLMGCETTPDTPTEELKPTVALTKGNESMNSVTFTLETTNATEARYMVLGDEESAPTLETIMAEGIAVELNAEGKAEVTAKGLEAETNYQIVAAAKNKTKMAGSNTLYVKTTAQAELAVDVELVNVTHETINFRYTATNAERAAYLVLYASKDTPEASYIFLNGEELDVNSKEAVEVKGLENVKEYQLVVAVEGDGQALVSEPIYFTTKDDPANVVEHYYTRVKGSKYGSNYYLMFSYEDANEAENFAYNEKTLCLDFYGDPDKDYLPAGTYEVKESTEWPCLNSMRYSTYGYDNGVQLKSGEAVVAIDPETKAYTFEMDLYLKDGRHLVAHYTGDVDNMPVIDIVTVVTTFNAASATTNDNGQNWTLNLTDAEGNKAVFNLANAFNARYIAKNSYTISTSAEEFAARPMTAEAGQFDDATSYFVVAGDTAQYKFSKGTLNVDIDWTNEMYYMTFYGELVNGYVIEGQFQGSVEGVSLAQSEEVIDVMMNVATARSFENNTNWYMTFTRTDNGVESYRLILDAFCPAMPYLPSGYYTTTGANDGCSLNIDGTTLYVAGEGQYSPMEARANVNIDMSAKSYTFDITFRVEDGRIFKFAYVGKVDGMEIVDAEDVPDTINWTTATAKHWYSDNWQLVIADETGAYQLDFDLRTGNSDINYLAPGVYELNADEAQYIDGNYSKFNGNAKAFKAAILSIMYNEGAQTYDIIFDVTLTDDRNLTGSYSGAVAGSPAA